MMVIDGFDTDTRDGILLYKKQIDFGGFVLCEKEENTFVKMFAQCTRHDAVYSRHGASAMHSHQQKCQALA